MNCSRSPFLFVLPTLALAVVATAQTTRSLPLHADLGDGHHSVAMPFGVPGFRTQILLDATAVGANGALLTGLRFRADRGSAPLTALTVPNVTVQLSHCTNSVGNMNGQFALNVTGTPSTVFSGAVTLPAQAPGFAGPAAWSIVLPFAASFLFDPTQGNLLVDIVGNNAPGQPALWWLDAVQGGGAATQFGASGDDPSFDHLNLLVSTGNSLEPRLLSPGHAIDFTSTLTFTAPPGVVALGTTGFAVPIDLAPLGAPTNSLYLDPLVLAPHSWNGSFIGNYSTFSLAVPNLATLIGMQVYGQSALLVPAANPLGLILSNAVEVRVGDQAEVLPMRQLDADDPAAVTGTFVDFGWANPDFGAVPVQLEGVFF